MAIRACALLRPIEITSATNTVVFNGSSQSIATGTYGCILTLFYEIIAHMTAAGVANPFCRFTTTQTSSTYGRTVIGSTSNLSITWTDSGLATILGYATSAVSGSTSYTSTSQAPSAWFSRYTPSDRDTWARDLRSDFAGQLSRTGELVGLATGPAIYKRALRFDGEPVARVFAAHATSAITDLETWVVGSRTSTPSTSTNPSTKGFYYFFDVADCATALSSVGSGSVVGWTGTSTDYVWCQLDPRGFDPPKASHGVTRDYYAFDLPIHTATAPTWNAP